MKGYVVLELDSSFRPLDGESISKLVADIANAVRVAKCFRPLDGESISKQNVPPFMSKFSHQFPSPRRGINF